MKKLDLVWYLLLLLCLPLWAGNHPSVFINQDEAAQLRQGLETYPLLQKSFTVVQKHIDEILPLPKETPPPGEGGGYSHERHKQNYRDMRNAALLFTITGEEKYAQYVRDFLYQYAEMYPKLGPHPLAHNQAPGRLFHQMLNETVWLLYTSTAYDCIYDWLKAQDRDLFEKKIFRPIATWFSQKNAHEFNRIHNHGTWTVASVGILGYVLHDQNLVDMALYGTEKDGKGGFLKQLDMLFSPDGYYMEGPYYARYALRPFFLFAEAIERNQPELKIFEYRDQILKKAFYAAAGTLYPNGTFPSINDASRTMNAKTLGPLIANDIVLDRYGLNDNLLGVAAFQDRVILNKAGLKVARALSEKGAGTLSFSWPSREFTDGFDGKKGGLAMLRNGKGADQSVLLMKYGVQGGGHGHFDKLHFSWYDQTREVIYDYGFSRWINIEPKFGGRYLPENKSYAKQTIAHNTVVVDQTSQNKAKSKGAEKTWAERHFFDASNPQVQIVSAKANQQYPGVSMQRTMLMIKAPRLPHPVIVDVFKLTSAKSHTYDYPLHYRGTLITTNLNYKSFTEKLEQLGQGYGYEHIWKTAQANPGTEAVRFTWLDGHRYYSFVSSAVEGRKVFFGRTGAADPNFNLLSEPMLILRDQGQNHIFASVVEAHGYFNEAQEKSLEARGRVKSVTVIGSNAEASIIRVSGKDGLDWLIMISNTQDDTAKQHEVTFDGYTYRWIGNYKVDLN